MISTTKQSNYLAKVVKLENPRKHSNADRLQCWTIDYQTVITDMSYQEGDIVIFIPALAQVNLEVLSKLNMFRHSNLNEDTTKIGYMEDNGRIKALSLRGEKSEGIILPFDAVCRALVGHTQDKIGDYINQYFDTIENKELCRKYQIETREKGEPNKQGQPKKKLIPEFFEFHYDTAKLAVNLHKFEPDDIIVITDKRHGTSGVSGNIPVKVNPNWIQRLFIWFNLIPNIPQFEYKNVWSSRKVVKGVGGNFGKEGYYSDDIWDIVNSELKPSIEEGITLYYEILGYLPSGKGIQGKYDYGCKAGEHRTEVYRITHTDTFGRVREFTWQQVKDYCQKYGLDTVHEFYYGNMINLYDSSTYTFMEYLTENFLEKDCPYCTNKVPAEGICVRLEKNDYKAYKLKSFRFLKGESEQQDKGESNIEDEQ